MITELIDRVSSGTWPMCVDELTCMVNFMNERDSYLIFDMLVLAF